MTISSLHVWHHHNMLSARLRLFVLAGHCNKHGKQFANYGFWQCRQDFTSPLRFGYCKAHCMRFGDQMAEIFETLAQHSMIQWQSGHAEAVPNSLSGLAANPKWSSWRTMECGPQKSLRVWAWNDFECIRSCKDWPTCEYGLDAESYLSTGFHWA